MGGLVCRGRQQFHFHPFSPKKQASDWLAPQEANVNNNNSLEAPIRGLLFGGKLEERNCHHPAPHQTSNHAQLVQRKSRMVLYSKASSLCILQRKKNVFPPILRIPLRSRITITFSMRKKAPRVMCGMRWAPWAPIYLPL